MRSLVPELPSGTRHVRVLTANALPLIKFGARTVDKIAVPEGPSSECVIVSITSIFVRFPTRPWPRGKPSGSSLVNDVDRVRRRESGWAGSCGNHPVVWKSRERLV
ncbi:hypothetical protein RSOL_207790 [Rhizoctonia solani AG-3 Rhs1AP]|uniref:Uncharacterized protein n=2 Tax=Rhizoctonia solani AG-3 TaxID=1086053 RepID=A0A074RR31_9AGAM|nr:hypothetical protein RSOL_207790 [Rhizoctonia solani AG-3 Rhs1AP]KEP47148.1 hypothetical protein V565_166390 [Rhizoctonia solani 123E]